MVETATNNADTDTRHHYNTGHTAHAMASDADRQRWRPTEKRSQLGLGPAGRGHCYYSRSVRQRMANGRRDPGAHTRWHMENGVVEASIVDWPHMHRSRSRPVVGSTPTP